MFELDTKLVLEQISALIYEVIYTVNELNDTNHKLVSFYYDTENKILDVSTYTLDNDEFSRSLMGKVKITSLKTQKIMNYITINVTAQDIRDELLENIRVIEHLLLY